MGKLRKLGVTGAVSTAVVALSFGIYAANTSVFAQEHNQPKVNRVEQAKTHMNEKATAKDIQKEMPKEIKVDEKQAQTIADQHNLANKIQYNAQKLFPDDVVITSQKQPDGTYVLTDMTSNKSFKLTVDKDGNIKDKEAI